MAIKRSFNFISQLRVDRPHLSSIESAVRNDFDELISSFIMGENSSYVIRGFEINMSGAVIGASATSLQLIVENSALLHGASIQSGTFYQIPSGESNQVINSTTNAIVQGSFTPSALNYIGIEFSRAVDNSTAAQVFLWNPTNKTEISKTIPLAEVLSYKIIVSPSIWASNVLPISTVATDSSNNVTSIEDNRPMLFRLGTAGTNTPDPFYKYPWTNHSEGRAENYWQTTSSTSPFKGGDKQLLNFKEWADAIMSSILEMKGTTYWYSPNTGSGSLSKLKSDVALLQMTGTGKFIHAAATAGQMNWTSDLYLDYVGSRLSYKINSYASGTGLILADNKVAYINLVRGVDIVPNLIFTQNSNTVSSFGAVPWTSDVIAGDYIKVSTENDTKYYEIASIPNVTTVILTDLFQESSTTTSAQYAYGSYQVVGTPSRQIQIADRKDVPFNEDVYWLFLRSDNGGPTARVYLRGANGGELQQGEDREISDNQTLDILDYIGSPAEVDTTPDYLNAITTSIKEQRLVTFPAASALTSGQYFTLNSALDIKQYYVWANINGAGGDPAPANLEGIEVNILSTDTALQVAAKYQAILDASVYFDSTDNLDGTISLDNSEFGIATNSANVDMGVGFSIATTTDGAGSFNRNLTDDENLTKSIKRLDEALGYVQDALDPEPYQEIIDVISGSPANDQEVTGPVVAGTSIKLPKNTNNANIQETYTVGLQDIEIMLNGQALVVTKDYTEVGLSGSQSMYIQLTFDLVIGDVLNFRKFTSNGALSSGGTASGLNLGTAVDADVFKQTIGNQLQFRRLEAGANMTITQSADKITFASSAGVAASNTILINGADYTILSTDDVVHVINSGVDVTLTLPDAATVPGKIYYIKKRDAGNTLYIKSTLGQTLDGVDIDATPSPITIQYEAVTIISMSGEWWLH